MTSRNSSNKPGFEPPPFEIDNEVDDSLVTPYAGVPLAIEMFRASGASAALDEHATVKQRNSGLSSSQMVESLLALWLAGGERCEDLKTFRQDEALSRLLGHELPSANAARDVLDRFHVEDGPLFALGEKASVPEESEALEGLGAANRTLVAALPSGNFGANAAWWRLNAAAYNLLSALKRVGLPGEFRQARPKRLRFSVFHTVGEVVRHARRTLLRLFHDKFLALLKHVRARIYRFQLALAGD